MKPRLIPPADYRTMPWKNGQGTTHEIAALRSEEDLRSGRFLWRLSIAEVGASSPFSLFPDCDRTILLLDGEGMQLDRGAAGSHALTTRFAPYSFAGEWPIDCRLVGGPCRDFNVMVDRRRASAAVSVLPLGAKPQLRNAKGQTVALFMLAGSARVTLDSQSGGSELLARHTLILSEEDAQEHAVSLTVRAQESEAQLLLIEIIPTRNDPSANHS